MAQFQAVDVKSSHRSFYLKSDTFQKAQNVITDFGLFCCTGLTKIIQSGHTGANDRIINQTKFSKTKNRKKLLTIQLSF